MKKYDGNKIRKNREEELLSILKQNPEDKKANLEMARMCLLSERELEAIGYLEKGKDESINQYQWIASHLVDHFYCRKLLAEKLKYKDIHGENALQKALQITGLHPSKNAGITVSAALIVKNEEKHLARCLDRIKDFVDEIVIVDTGSTDNTVEIAKSYGAKIGYYEWNDDYSAARNEVIKLASCHWILCCDADEILDPASIPKIQGAITRPQFGAFSAFIKSYMQNEESREIFTSKIIRLFRNFPDIKFEGRIHEQIFPSIEAKGYTSAEIPGFIFEHYGYQPSVMEEKKKLDRTFNILYAELRDNPEDPFHWFNLANTFAVSGDNYSLTECAEQGLKLLKQRKTTSTYKEVLLQLLCKGYTETGNYDGCLEVADYALKNGYYNIIFQTGIAHIYFLKKNYEKALEEVNKAIEMEWDYDLCGDKSIFEYKKYILKGDILLSMKRYQEAIETIDKVLTIKPDFHKTKIMKAHCYIELKEYNHAKEVLNTIPSSKELNKNKFTLLCNCYFSTQNFKEYIQYAEKIFNLRSYHPTEFAKWAYANEVMKLLPNLPLAEKIYQEISHTDPGALINMSRIYKMHKMNSEAIQLLNQYVEKHPLDQNAYLNLADNYFDKKDFASAASQYQNALRIDPNNAAAWLCLGSSFSELGSLEGAKLGFSKALELNPALHEAKDMLDLIIKKEESNQKESIAQ